MPKKEVNISFHRANMALKCVIGLQIEHSKCVTSVQIKHSKPWPVSIIYGTGHWWRILNAQSGHRWCFWMPNLETGDAFSVLNLETGDAFQCHISTVKLAFMTFLGIIGIIMKKWTTFLRSDSTLLQHIKSFLNLTGSL